MNMNAAPSRTGRVGVYVFETWNTTMTEIRHKLQIIVTRRDCDEVQHFKQLVQESHEKFMACLNLVQKWAKSGICASGVIVVLEFGHPKYR